MGSQRMRPWWNFLLFFTHKMLVQYRFFDSTYMACMYRMYQGSLFCSIWSFQTVQLQCLSAQKIQGTFNLQEYWSLSAQLQILKKLCQLEVKRVLCLYVEMYHQEGTYWHSSYELWQSQKSLLNAKWLLWAYR